MEKFYLNEIRRNGEISTVSLYYSRAEAEGIVKKLQELPNKQDCRYEITGSPPPQPAKSSPRK